MQWPNKSVLYYVSRVSKEGKEKNNNSSKMWLKLSGGLQRLSGRSEYVTRTIFDKATRSLGTISVMSKVALIAGSSQQGKALRASVACRGRVTEDKTMWGPCALLKKENLRVFTACLHHRGVTFWWTSWSDLLQWKFPDYTDLVLTVLSQAQM